MYTNTHMCVKERAANTPWLLRAVKRMVPVSSPIKHSAIRVFWFWGPRNDIVFRGFLLSTVLEFNTFTIRVWPVVPGFKESTFTNTGFLNPELWLVKAASADADCSVGFDGSLVAIGRQSDRVGIWGFSCPVLCGNEKP